MWTVCAQPDGSTSSLSQSTGCSPYVLVHIVGPLAATIYCRHYEEWWQHTPLSFSNTHCEQLWFHSTATNTNFRVGMQWFDGQQQVAVNTVLPQYSHSFSRYTRSLWFLEVYKTSVSLAYSQDLAKICWRTKNWSVVLRRVGKPHWLSSSFGSIISRHLYSRHLAQLYVSKELKTKVPLWMVHSFLIPYLCKWTFQFASLSVPFQKSRPFCTRVSQTTARFKPLSISCQISSQPALQPSLKCFDS